MPGTLVRSRSSASTARSAPSATPDPASQPSDCAGGTGTPLPPTNQGAYLLIAEGGTPKLVKGAYLTDTDIHGIADYATWIRRPTGLTTPDTGTGRMAA